MAYSLQIVAMVAFVMIRCGLCQQCPPPTNAQIEGLLAIVRSSLSAEGGPESAIITQSHITAVAVGTVRNMYREVAIAIKYTTSGGNFTAHIQARCSGGTTYGIKDFEGSIPDSTFEITRRNDCRLVLGPVGNGHPDYDSVTNCLSCSSSCNAGLRGCTNSLGTACCTYYDMEDMCVTACPPNTSPDATNTCAAAVCGEITPIVYPVQNVQQCGQDNEILPQDIQKELSTFNVPDCPEDLDN